MPKFRITKFDPSKRDADGKYLDCEWTSASDVGRAFAGKILELEEYVRTEDSYVEAVNHLMQAAGISELRIDSLEDHGAQENLASELLEVNSVARDLLVDGKAVGGEVLGAICRLCLREMIWCQLSGPRNFYVHFGYDYYMYVGFDGELLMRPSIPGLFVEDFDSPYAAE